MPPYYLYFQAVICNLPLLFSLFINDLGSELNLSGLGIDLQGINISAISFADDLVIIAKTRNALDSLMRISSSQKVLNY